jgi:hypothetical protein
MMSRSSTIILLLALSLLSAASTSIVYAQKEFPNTVVSPRKPPTITQQSPSSPSAPQSSSLQLPPSSLTSKLHAVKITSPTKGQQVPTGKDLTVSGATAVAAGNPTSHCQVSIIVNGIKPYQPATGAGAGGVADYSKWNYLLSSKYTTIKQGPNNKITAKYVCSSNPSEVSFYSVNVTGVGISSPTPTPTAAVTGQTKAPIVTAISPPKTQQPATTTTTTTSSFPVPLHDSSKTVTPSNNNPSNKNTIPSNNNEPKFKTKILKSFNNEFKH